MGVSGVGLGVGALGRLGRSGSRRSGYAFAHQEGFGELITSGKNMRLSSLALANFASRHSSSWIDTLRKKKHANSANGAVGANGQTGAPHTPPGPASAPPLSNSSSLSGTQDTPPEEAGLSSFREEGVARDGVQSSGGGTTSHGNRCARATSPDGETGGCSFGAVQVRD